ncbi:MAG: DEAD/DEAH box helicase, partial [Verrucomicrobia bacterium]|nr:DEAD/DEAH box helicase [Verrucomicrobiota bacterium]
MLMGPVNLFDLIQERVPNREDATSERLLEVFMDYIEELKLELYPAQEEGILELFDDKNVILNTPTGSGKSLVAMALHFKSLAQGRKSVYTSPIKALVNEKFLDLCGRFGANQVGLMTGDATVNRDAPILCCTAEILANIALHEGDQAE